MMNPKFYIVGGYVRDKLLGLIPKDKDYVVVGATPDWMLANGFKKVGASFPVFLNDAGEEFALARTERKVANGHAGFKTEYSSSVTLEDDLIRRDLTINAIAMDPDTGKYIDPHGGIYDINAKRLRAVSDAFMEDPLRVFRLGRIYAKLQQHDRGWIIDDETMDMCKLIVLRDETLSLSTERKTNEFLRVFNECNGEFISIFLEFLVETGIMHLEYPELLSTAERFSLKCSSIRPNVRNIKYNQHMYYMLVLLSFLSENELENLQEKMNFPNIYINLIKLYNQIDMNSSLILPDPVGVLHQLGLYNNSKYLELLDSSISDFRVSDLMVILNQTKDIGFDNLPTSLQKTLKGNEISKAIISLRKEFYHICKNYI